MGQFVASGVLRGSLSRTDEWAYKIPFAVQWVWPIPLLIGCYLAPESPWWEVRRGNPAGARRALERLTTKGNPDYNVDEVLAMIEHTNELERNLSEGTSYLDCFRGVNLRRTEIVCCCWLVQTLCGTNIMGYSTYFMKQAGLPTIQSFNMSLGQYSLGVVGTILSWFLMARAGRRTIYLCGVATLFTLLMIVGFVSLSKTTGATWAIGAMLLVFTFIYDFTVGPVCYSLVSELSSTRLKTKTIVLARIGYNISNTVINVLTNYQLNKTAWNWGAKTAFFWAGTGFFCLLWIFFRLPEPKGRSYGELDVLFEDGVSPRKFKSTKVELFGEGAAPGIVREKDDSV
jgi:SP family general alpha glucoside:H+ symporter-like MFS transporter